MMKDGEQENMITVHLDRYSIYIDWGISEKAKLQ